MAHNDLTDNAYITMISRFSMIAATAALPLVGWVLARGVTTIDDVSRSSDIIRDRVMETGANVKLIQQTQQLQTAIMSDHEARIRALEKIQLQLQQLQQRP